jgi:hypothetical protein
VLTQPNEPYSAPRQPTRSKAYERWMGALFFFGTLGFISAIFYVAGLYS